MIQVEQVNDPICTRNTVSLSIFFSNMAPPAILIITFYYKVEFLFVLVHSDSFKQNSIRGTVLVHPSFFTDCISMVPCMLVLGIGLNWDNLSYLTNW
jgi:hypothetical protein